MNKKDFVEYILSLSTLHEDNSWHPLITTCKLVRNSVYVQCCIRMYKALWCLRDEPKSITFVSEDKPRYYGGNFLNQFGSNWISMFDPKKGVSFYVILYDGIIYKKNDTDRSYPCIFVDITKNPDVLYEMTSSFSGALLKYIIYD